MRRMGMVYFFSAKLRVSSLSSTSESLRSGITGGLGDVLIVPGQRLAGGQFELQRWRSFGINAEAHVGSGLNEKRLHVGHGDGAIDAHHIGGTDRQTLGSDRQRIAADVLLGRASCGGLVRRRAAPSVGGDRGSPCVSWQ